ncbi:hypothetical protein [Shimia sp. SK013]|uniref:hypothetical protein n=1 Tax=Shimia sp. SK013 TaxID=1389006 RepID=UPI00128F9E16|nr:hypothetical protein [Shimia sp. SK013]
MLRILAVILASALLVPNTGGAQTNQRTQFNEGLANFNELVMQRKIGDAIDLIRTDLNMSAEERGAINSQMQLFFEEDFLGSATVRSQALKNGFRQELLSYWTSDGDYLYIYLFMHSRENIRKILDIRYDLDFHDLNALF